MYKEQCGFHVAGKDKNMSNAIPEES